MYKRCTSKHLQANENCICVYIVFIISCFLRYCICKCNWIIWMVSLLCKILKEFWLSCRTCSLCIWCFLLLKIIFFFFQETNNVFSSTFAESTARLKSMGKKLGSCIEKARPYYEALELARTSQSECQRAAVQYQRANGRLSIVLYHFIMPLSCHLMS